MDTYKKNRFLFWLLIFLVVVNLSALATFLIFSTKPVPVSCGESASKPGGALCEQLGLTSAQTLEVEKINTLYRDVTTPIVAEIKEKRMEILDELNKDNPDTMHLNNLTLDLSTLQSRMQRASFRQFLELKTVCTPEQVKRLSALYRDLYGCPMKGKGQQNRYRHGKGQQGCEK